VPNVKQYCYAISGTFDELAVIVFGYSSVSANFGLEKILNEKVKISYKNSQGILGHLVEILSLVKILAEVRKGCD
jgi:hypothetical protein